MTLDERLREIDALYEKATKGPWDIHPETGSVFQGERYLRYLGALKAQSDNDLIVALVNAWPDIAAALRDRWIPVSERSIPKDGSSFLVANAAGHVAPHIRGVIHNNVGTANDWAYGESITHWMPLPEAPSQEACDD